MEALIDQVLETVLHSAIWRSTWHMGPTTLIIVAVVAFVLLAIRRSRKTKTHKKQGYKYRRRYRK